MPGETLPGKEKEIMSRKRGGFFNFFDFFDPAVVALRSGRNDGKSHQTAGQLLLLGSASPLSPLLLRLAPRVTRIALRHNLSSVAVEAGLL
jgi:hypothetical protein